MFNIHSIFFKINIAFALSMIVMAILYIFGYTFLNHGLRKERIDRSLQLHRLLLPRPFDNRVTIEEEILKLGFELVDDINIRQMRQQLHRVKPYFIHPPRGRIRGQLPRNRDIRRGHPPLVQNNMRLHQVDNQFYLHTKNRRGSHLFRDTHANDTSNIKIFTVIFILTTLFFGVLFFLLKRNLLGLKRLDSAIEHYAKGEIDQTLKNSKKDEISHISNTFHTMATHLKQIEAGRTLFLRNMMHELKTPLTKSSLYAQTLEESITKEKLLISLSRQEQIINEMAQIESISSKQFTLNKKVYRLEDMIDEAIDLLQIEPKYVNRILCEESYKIDFKPFSIVIKNFIDNAVKYATDRKITIKADSNSISFISLGEKLAFSLENYTEPFFKGEYNEVNSKGFGLGLYIISEIVKKHKAKLKYTYEDGKNIFIVEL